MEFMKNIIFTACILSVVITIAGNLKSGEKFSRQLNVIFALVFSAGVLGAAVKTGIDFQIPDLNTEAYSENFSDVEKNAQGMLKSEIEIRVNKIIGDLLYKNNISFDEINTDINILEDGSININKIDYKGDEFEKAEKIIKENFQDTEVKKNE